MEIFVRTIAMEQPKPKVKGKIQTRWDDAVSGLSHIRLQYLQGGEHIQMVASGNWIAVRVWVPNNTANLKFVCSLLSESRQAESKWSVLIALLSALLSRRRIRVADSRLPISHSTSHLLTAY